MAFKINWSGILSAGVSFLSSIADNVVTEEAAVASSGAPINVSSVATAAKGAAVQALTASNGMLTTDVANAVSSAVSSAAGPQAGQLAGAVVGALVDKGLGTFEAHNKGVQKSAS